MAFDLKASAARAIGEGGPAGAIAYEDMWRSRNWVRDASARFDALLAGRPAIGLIAANRPHHAVLCLANIAAGRTTAMINRARTGAGLAREIGELALPAIVGDRSDWSEAALAAARACGSLALATDESEAGISVEILARGDAVSGGPGARTAALELLSSGTTGEPKRIALSWQTIASAVEQAGFAYAGSESAAPQVMIHPLGNVAGLAYAIPPLVFGRPLVMLDRFSVAGWAQAVRTYRPVRATVPPAGIAMLLSSDVPAEWLDSLQLLAVGGGKLPTEDHDAFEERFDVPVLTAYGATEFAGVIANWTLEEYRRVGRAKRGSAGRASPGVELRTVDPDSGQALPVGQAGLLEALVPRIGADWIRTSDLARIDGDGFLFLEGRADGAINRGGFKIVPETLAAVLRSHPAVGDAAVVGIADPRLGEVPVAAVEPAAGATPSAGDLLDWLRDRVASYQLPVAIKIVARLPRNASLKVALGDVRALFAD